MTESLSSIAGLVSEYSHRLALALPTSDSARLDVEILLCHVLEKPRSYLFTWPEQTLNATQLRRFEQLIQARMQGQPVAYLTGSREFWSLPLQVNHSTLIPRPDTEVLVEAALQCIPRDCQGELIDLGTGSGAIALAIASERPLLHVHGVDNNPDAVQLAQTNASNLGLHNCQFRQGNWLENLTGPAPDFIVSNPPYIAENDPHLDQGDVRFEPRSALTAGKDGLDDIRVICQQAMQHLNSGGWLLLEHGYNQAEDVRTILESNGYTECQTIKDYQGNWRVSMGKK